MNKKIKKALKRGDLIDFDELSASYPKKRREEILRRARYIMAAMELRKLRRQLALSQEDLSKRMNVRREFISRIEGGKQNITLDTLFKIADATGKKFRFSFE